MTLSPNQNRLLLAVCGRGARLLARGVYCSTADEERTLQSLCRRGLVRQVSVSTHPYNGFVPTDAGRQTAGIEV